MPDFSIRTANLEDIPRLTIAARKFFDETFSSQNDPETMQDYLDASFTEDKFISQFLADDSTFILAEANSEIVAYARLRKNPEVNPWLGDLHIELERFYLDATLHGSGLAGLLMQEVFRIAQGSGWIWLGVWEKNPRAIRFYEKHGFEVFASHPFRMGDEIQTDLLMRRVV